MAVDHTADVHAAITLTTGAQDITTNITNPSVARALSVTGTKAGATLTGTVTLTGTDEFGQTATEAFALDGNYTLFGLQAFATVTNINVPIKVTTGDTVKVGLADRLFDISDARLFDKAQLTNSTTYTDAAVLAAEERIRSSFEKICGVAFIPTYRREYLSGEDRCTLWLPKLRPLAVTACVVYDSTMTATETFDAADLTDLALDEDGLIVRRAAGWFPKGFNNVLITYLHGYAATPPEVRRAALLVCVNSLVASNVAPTATSYSDGDLSYSLYTPGANWGFWYPVPEVNAILAQYYERGIS